MKARRVKLGSSVLFPDQVKYTIVDAEDYALAKASGPWWPSAQGDTIYARRRGQSLHRIVMRAPSGKHVDHIDGNGLNNRKDNLRLTDRSGNERNRNRINRNNTSGCPGVCKDKHGKWVVRIGMGSTANGFKVVAYVRTLSEATEVRRAAEVLVYGEHAPRKTKAKGTLVGKFKTLAELKAHFPKMPRVGVSGVAGISATGNQGKPGSQWKVRHKGKIIGYYATIKKAKAALKALS